MITIWLDPWWMVLILRAAPGSSPPAFESEPKGPELKGDNVGAELGLKARRGLCFFFARSSSASASERELDGGDEPRGVGFRRVDRRRGFGDWPCCCCWRRARFWRSKREGRPFFFLVGGLSIVVIGRRFCFLMPPPRPLHLLFYSILPLSFTLSLPLSLSLSKFQLI